MNDQEELLNTMVLTRVSYFNISTVLALYQAAGSATEVLAHRHHLDELLPELPARVVEILNDLDPIRRRVEEELEWVMKNDVQCLCFNDPQYPRRLKQCDDAPLMLFYKGTADLNQEHIINIVGTRRCTTYGQDMVRKFVGDLHQFLPDTLIVSGLAYGIDIQAHRNALLNGMNTLGVLAHGLDDLYPHQHLQTAREMLRHGGLITEFMTHTKADKLNFVRRNRITAGLCDATIVVESAHKGGGLITARIARDYNRDVFAFPGPVGAEYSEGCNNLIRDNGAQLITSADDLVKFMGWEYDKERDTARKSGIERQLFPNLSPEEQAIVKALEAHNDLQLNILSVKTGLPVAKATSLLFGMEMKGVVKALAGGTYHLLS
jgi:DNA processing protein